MGRKAFEATWAHTSSTNAEDSEIKIKNKNQLYRFTSILGQIYDGFQSCKNEKLPVQGKCV